MSKPLRTSLFATCLVAGGMLLPSAATAACQGEWSLEGIWTLDQDNGFVVELRFWQDGNRLSGSAHTESDRSDQSDFTGKIKGDTFSFTVPWNASRGAVGVYKGVIDFDGAIGGTTYDKNHREAGDSEVRWHGNREASCIAAIVDQEPTPQPLALGRVKLPEGATPPEICDAARSARARGSPAAPGLEARCLAAEAAQP